MSNPLTTFWHRLGSPQWFYKISGPWVVGFGLLALLLLVAGAVWALVYAPPDYQQGKQRAHHVYTRTHCYGCAELVFGYGCGRVGTVRLADETRRRDDCREFALRNASNRISIVQWLGVGTAHVGYLVGMGWADSIYARLVFFYIWAFFALRGAIEDSEIRSRASALVAIVGTINIPIIKYSVDWWQTLHQPASFTLTEKPTMPPEMYLPLLVMGLGMYCFRGV